MAIQPKVRTVEDPTIVYTEYTEIQLDTTSFILLLTIGGDYIIQNKSGKPVYVVQSTSSTEILSTDTQMSIGGITHEINTDGTKYTWIRATAAGSIISVRPSGSLDPNGDITKINELINSVALSFKAHKEDKSNVDHAVSAEQVGLGNIPNAISNDPTANDEKTLATTALTALIKKVVDEHIGAKGNVHTLLKSDINLGNVANYSVADVKNGDDLMSTVDDKYVTPAVCYRISQLATTVARSASAQMILDGKMGERPDGWFVGECDIPTSYLEFTGNNSVVIRSGLRVSFGTEYKTAISEFLSNDIPLSIPSINGLYYIYVDISGSNLITSAGYSITAPEYGVYRDASSVTGDYYNYALCQMYDKTGAAVRRVYIGKVVVSSGMVTTIVQLPIGNRYVFPITSTLALSGRTIHDNPFLTSLVKVTAEVAYQNHFHPTGWNDQIGVTADTHPATPADDIVLQCGMSGFLCAGKESGNAFGSAFTTITSPPRARVIVERTLF